MAKSDQKNKKENSTSHRDRELMKVAVYYNNRDVRLEDRPMPVIGPGEMMVKIEACGLCGGDTMEWYLLHKAPLILGHEPVGTVVEVGEGVDKFKVGDRVFMHHHVPCFSCHVCRRGDFTMCDHFTETHLYPQAFAEFVRVPAENVQHDSHILPDHISFEEGTLVEPMACVVKGIKKAGIQPGDTVAIVGAGLMGLGFAQLAPAWGATNVIVFDLNDWRLSMALNLGADHVINPKNVPDPIQALKTLNQGRVADSVIVTPNGVQAIEFGLSLAGKGATLHLFSPSEPDETIVIKPNDLFFREITLTTTYSCSHLDTAQALSFIANGTINAAAMITHRFGLDQVAQAIEVFLNAEDSVKSVIMPELTSGIGDVE
jgi:L-iditol 2-dehydrogenase